MRANLNVKADSSKCIFDTIPRYFVLFSTGIQSYLVTRFFKKSWDHPPYAGNWFADRNEWPKRVYNNSSLSFLKEQYHRTEKWPRSNKFVIYFAGLYLNVLETLGNVAIFEQKKFSTCVAAQEVKLRSVTWFAKTPRAINWTGGLYTRNFDEAVTRHFVNRAMVVCAWPFNLLAKYREPITGFRRRKRLPKATRV